MTVRVYCYIITELCQSSLATLIEHWLRLVVRLAVTVWAESLDYILDRACAKNQGDRRVTLVYNSTRDRVKARLRVGVRIKVSGRGQS